MYLSKDSLMILHEQLNQFSLASYGGCPLSSKECADLRIFVKLVLKARSVAGLISSLSSLPSINSPAFISACRLFVGYLIVFPRKSVEKTIKRPTSQRSNSGKKR